MLLYYLYSLYAKEQKPNELFLLVVIYFTFHFDNGQKLEVTFFGESHDVYRVNDFPFSSIKHEIERMKDSYSFTITETFNLTIVMEFMEYISEYREDSEISEDSDNENENETRSVISHLRSYFNHLFGLTGEPQIINVGKKFKLGECVICLTKSPNVLFCNFGHIPICIECDETKSLTVCPVGKTCNSIRRII